MVYKERAGRGGANGGVASTVFIASIILSVHRHGNPTLLSASRSRHGRRQHAAHRAGLGDASSTPTTVFFHLSSLAVARTASPRLSLIRDRVSTFIGRCRGVVCVSKYLSQGTAVCAVAAVRGCVPASVSTHCFRVNSTSYGVSALVPLRPSGELPVRLLPAARGRYLYPPSPVSLVRLGVTRPLQFTVCYAGTEGLGT